MENYIPISFLNDFIFCPRSIYFHSLFNQRHHGVYKQKAQLDGEAAHETIDNNSYSSSLDILQGVDIYCEKYNLCGKIDIFDIGKGKLIERKRSIEKIFDGYIFQVYAQYFSLTEMGYKVKEIIIHDLVHNKNYPIPLPNEDKVFFEKFEKVIEDINNYSLKKDGSEPILEKCRKCIYNTLCDIALC